MNKHTYTIILLLTILIYLIASIDTMSKKINMVNDNLNKLKYDISSIKEETKGIREIYYSKDESDKLFNSNGKHRGFILPMCGLEVSIHFPMDYPCFDQENEDIIIGNYLKGKLN